MGAGRKTSTSSYDSAASPKHRVPIPPDRDLRDALGGVIFGATADTLNGAPRAGSGPRAGGSDSAARSGTGGAACQLQLTH
jgi:hypothetical protein